jgi:hypothetical protein
VAREVLVYAGMKPQDDSKDPNQGEGDRKSARRYNDDVRGFVAEGKVESAARDAAQFVEAEPEEAKAAEQRAKRGPRGVATKVSVDELLAKGRTVIDRMRPIVERVVERVKAKFSK